MFVVKSTYMYHRYHQNKSNETAVINLSSRFAKFMWPLQNNSIVWSNRPRTLKGQTKNSKILHAGNLFCCDGLIMLLVISKVSQPATHCNSGKMTTNMSKPPKQNKFPACNIFELPHYFLFDPYTVYPYLKGTRNFTPIAPHCEGVSSSKNCECKGVWGSGVVQHTIRVWIWCLSWRLSPCVMF